jgi:hypothetical protein
MAEVQVAARWDAAFEDELFNEVLRDVAPHLPDIPPTELREPRSAEEIAEAAEFTARLAAHDTFIVQAVSKAIARLDFDTDFHLKLSRQVGDDGHHAELARERLIELTGSDQLPKIEAYIDELWKALGDLPYRDVFGFLAFQFHYELHIQGRLKTEGRTAKVRFGRARQAPVAEGASAEANDELVHRINIVRWVQKTLGALPQAQRAEWIAKLIEADDDAQRRLNPYLRHRIANAGRAWQSDVSNVVPIYDGFRRAVLAYLVEQPAAELPPLTSLAA